MIKLENYTRCTRALCVGEGGRVTRFTQTSNQTKTKARGEGTTGLKDSMKANVHAIMSEVGH